ncbi:hypothetical protein ACFV2X_38210 [Streptomyces sp. NPDC059679]|uniref:hypothetical protein n=1 Tax=Streptomyces sp. NPDC059679 TaxID=3346903 RepID=UPI0036AE00B0
MTPDDYDKLFEEARDGAPFSNSSQGYSWMANWCDRCIHDKPARQGNDGQGCPLILVALMDKTPIQWLCETKEQAIHADYHCIEFRDEDDGPGGEPRPIPDPPGQLTLLPRGEYEGVRMLTPFEPDQIPATLP